MVVVGSSILQREDGSAIHSAIVEVAQNARKQSGCGEGWKVLNVLHRVRNNKWKIFTKILYHTI